MGCEHLGHVHILGLGPTLGRSSYSTNRASILASQDLELVSHVTQLKAQVTRMQMAHEMQKNEMGQMVQF
jgi:hypothetical protein